MGVSSLLREIVHRFSQIIQVRRRRCLCDEFVSRGGKWAENCHKAAGRAAQEQRAHYTLFFPSVGSCFPFSSARPHRHMRAPTSTNVNHARVKPRLPLRAFQNNSIKFSDNGGAGWCQALEHGPMCRFFRDVNNRCALCDFQGETIEDVITDGFHTTGFWLNLRKCLSEMLEKDVVLLFFSKW